ncbi:diacylglycerol kinase [Microbacterium abyssi]|uniref:diacylglycerol kinase n=1 Tax=Microbacterium abyssi TaxID=2782166 RepID=UPI001886BB9A|nr:diacylglycerol kinase [Microbacterium sp. A18JL241]
MRNVHVLINPDAGRGKGSARAEAALTRLRDRGIDPVVHSGGSPEDSRRLAADAVAAGPDALVIVGGDGTLATVVDVLAGSGIPLVLVPAGTGNDLARSLGIPYGSDEAAADAATAAIDGVLRSLDVGEAICPDATARFLTVAALGFDAKVSERTNRLRWPRGRARYYLALLIELARLAPMRFSVRVDGAAAPVADGTLIAVGNTRSYGGGMPVCPGADPHDGLFDITHVAHVGRFQLLRLFPRLLRGTHVQLPQVTTMRGREVEVSAPGLVVYADGERIGTGSVRIRVVPGALSILLPH